MYIFSKEKLLMKRLLSEKKPESEQKYKQEG